MRKRRESSSSKLLKIKPVRKIVAGARAEDVCPPLPQPIPSGADSPSQSPKGRGGFSAGDDGSLSPGPLNLQHTFSTLGSGLPGPRQLQQSWEPGEDRMPVPQSTPTKQLSTFCNAQPLMCA